MTSELKTIQQLLKEKSVPEAVGAYKKFVPGNMKIYGVRTPELNELSKQFKAGGFDLIKTLWDAGALEEKILAVKILQKIAKQDAAISLQLVQYFAPGIDNWAVCDAVGMQALQYYQNTCKRNFCAGKKIQPLHQSMGTQAEPGIARMVHQG